MNLEKLRATHEEIRQLRKRFLRELQEEVKVGERVYWAHGYQRRTGVVTEVGKYEWNPVVWVRGGTGTVYSLDARRIING